jgi:pyrroloquinoline quinone biosynthesis protein D
MIWKPASRVAEVRTAAGTRVALLQLDAAQPVVLEGSAAAIWQLVDGNKPESTIIAELESQFDPGHGGLRAQVEEFLRRLADQKLIEPSGSKL